MVCFEIVLPSGRTRSIKMLRQFLTAWIVLKHALEQILLPKITSKKHLESSNSLKLLIGSKKNKLSSISFSWVTELQTAFLVKREENLNIKDSFRESSKEPKTQLNPSTNRWLTSLWTINTNKLIRLKEKKYSIDNVSGSWMSIKTHATQVLHVLSSKKLKKKKSNKQNNFNCKKILELGDLPFRRLNMVKPSEFSNRTVVSYSTTIQPVALMSMH